MGGGLREKPLNFQQGISNVQVLAPTAQSFELEYLDELAKVNRRE